MLSLIVEKIYQLIFWTSILLLPVDFYAQESSSVDWIRPNDERDNAMWGIKGGIVVGLWPTSIEYKEGSFSGGPRGLFRMGLEASGQIHMLNFIAIEPVVDGELEFSEISPSRVDGKWGKLMWAGDHKDPGSFYPAAGARGVITHPDPINPAVEQLSFYIFLEKFLSGAHPYIKVNIRSDRPEEIGFVIYNREGSADMERCVLTATMGNYSRMRLLHLNEEIIDARKLYQDYEDVHFIEKEEYPRKEIYRNAQGDYLAAIETNESFSELASWPQTPEYFARQNWRYSPFFKIVQYWRKEGNQAKESLRVRVNGRSTYWAGASNDKSRYVKIPGGPAFENFEMREEYYAGQTFYFGISRKPIEKILE
ncbi:MAG: hypothetical protein JJE07_00800 [Flavobacteriaceae bacterium]|nr:hypothetical protein [Flavobacteriaceae bacterium]